jgi:hypothetical protein
MPQDELWAASARSTGLTFELRLYCGAHRDQLQISTRPLWSKTPSGRVGFAAILAEDYALWEVPTLFNAVFEQWAGGDPKHVPSVLQHAMRGIEAGYSTGQLGQ